MGSQPTAWVPSQIVIAPTAAAASRIASTSATSPVLIWTALKATAPIGDGLYGVDIKQNGDRIVVIEVNDNPSIDAGVEDAYLGEDLYLRIMQEFLRRMERKRLGIVD